MTYYIIITAISLTGGFFLGEHFGKRTGRKRFLRALKVPPGYRITSVGYEKIKKATP